MRTDKVAAVLLFLLAAAPLRAAINALDACKQLEAQALTLTPEKLHCEAGPSGLILQGVSATNLRIIQQGLFPEQRYLGHAVVIPTTRSSRAVSLPSQIVIRSQAEEMTAASARLQNSPAVAQAVAANFDNAVAHTGQALGANAVAWTNLSERDTTLSDAIADVKLVLAGGPPGSGGDQQDPPRRNGPPGSGGDRQDPPRRDGPPGSGGQNPPGNSTPPSRPAPVWRTNIPAPAPNWWNTDFNHYDWWNDLPSGYDRPHKDQSNPDTFFYYSRWYHWRNTFVTNWVRTEDTASISRTAANQGQIHSRSLTSQVYRESKECYYQAVYRYDWSQGGFYGSHWEESFDHYKARCIRQPREYDRPQVYTTHVSFDMGLVSGLDLPWESDVIRIRYDGRGQPRYDFSDAAYKYSPRLDDQRPGSESVTLVAGAKVLRAPESDKVQAFLRNNAGKIELVINDDRASYYQGETLRVNAKVVRRVVIKVKGLLWGWNEKNVDSVIHNGPLDILVDANSSQSVTDLTGAANAPKPANAVRSSVFIDSWEFSRVNSRISTGVVIRKGRGAAVSN